MINDASSMISEFRKSETFMNNMKLAKNWQVFYAFFFFVLIRFCSLRLRYILTQEL